MRALLAMAACRLLLHTLTNGQYGFHCDELATLDDARHLDWGFVAYPPFTPFVARVALELFGSAPGRGKILTALAQCIDIVVAGLMAHELGGGRRAQVITGVAVAVSPVLLSAGICFSTFLSTYCGQWSRPTSRRGCSNRRISVGG